MFLLVCCRLIDWLFCRAICGSRKSIRNIAMCFQYAREIMSRELSVRINIWLNFWTGRIWWLLLFFFIGCRFILYRNLEVFVSVKWIGVDALCWILRIKKTYPYAFKASLHCKMSVNASILLLWMFSVFFFPCVVKQKLVNMHSYCFVFIALCLWMTEIHLGRYQY